MRPVLKQTPIDANGNPKTIFNPHGTAYLYLETNLGTFCSYCEVFSSDLEVEHIVSQHQDSSLATFWDNFLLACGRCNGADNKGSKPVDFQNIHFPHLNNTLLSLVYLEGGLVTINPNLSQIAREKAQTLINLVGLSKPQYLPRDERWRFRFEAWNNATNYLADYEAGTLNENDILAFAQQRGFFSIWFTVFTNHPAVRLALIQGFAGTDINCFDANDNYNPIPRNPNNNIDNT